MNCINCNQEISGNFCSNCSQRTHVKRITFKEGWFDFWARIYGFDGMFPRTLRDLTIRPGAAARKFIEGNRVLYYGPVGYFFLMITLMLLSYDMIGVSFMEVMKASGAAVVKTDTQNQQAFTEKVFQIISDNLKIFFFLFIPFQAFAARYIFFRKSGLNYLEHSILPFYVMGHDLWMNIVLGVVYAINGQYYTWSAFITFFYFGYAYSTMMTYQSRIKAFFKGIALWLVSYVLLLITIMVVILGVIMVMKVLSPDTLKSWFTS